MSDAITMVRRNVRHTRRNPIVLIMTIALPVFMLLLFVGIFGDALKAGFGAAAQGKDYIDYLLPGILLMAVGYGASQTAMAVNQDVTTGIISRFRTMAISRASVLTGHVLVSTVRTLVSAALVTAVAVLLGFRSGAGVAGWLGAAGLLALVTLALTLPAVAVWLAAGSAEGTTPFLFVVQLLPFVSSAFVPPGSMSGAVRWFAANEPFTPVIDAIRALLLGTPVPHGGAVALAWCAGLAVAGYGWARLLFR
ncbi:ABC transporter permease, partial [Micromonospora zhanjiangensis]